jgi:hypothetical protein
MTVAGNPAVMNRRMAERASQQRVLSLILTGFPFHAGTYRQHQNGTNLIIIVITGSGTFQQKEWQLFISL